MSAANDLTFNEPECEDLLKCVIFDEGPPSDITHPIYKREGDVFHLGYAVYKDGETSEHWTMRVVFEKEPTNLERVMKKLRQMMIAVKFS
jgi:hypothetical protein